MKEWKRTHYSAWIIKCCSTSSVATALGVLIKRINIIYSPVLVLGCRTKIFTLTATIIGISQPAIIESSQSTIKYKSIFFSRRYRQGISTNEYCHIISRVTRIGILSVFFSFLLFNFRHHSTRKFTQLGSQLDNRGNHYGECPRTTQWLGHTLLHSVCRSIELVKIFAKIWCDVYPLLFNRSIHGIPICSGLMCHLSLFKKELLVLIIYPTVLGQRPIHTTHASRCRTELITYSVLTICTAESLSSPSFCFRRQLRVLGLLISEPSM